MKKKSDIEFLSETEESEEIRFLDEEKEVSIPRPTRRKASVGLMGKRLFQKIRYIGANRNVRTGAIIFGGLAVLTAIIAIVWSYGGSNLLNSSIELSPQEPSTSSVDFFDIKNYELSPTSLVDRNQPLVAFFLSHQYSEEEVVKLVDLCREMGLNQIDKDAEFRAGHNPKEGARIVLYEIPWEGRFFVFANREPWVKERVPEVEILKREWLLKDSLLYTLDPSRAELPQDLLVELERILSWTVGIKQLKRGHQINLLTETRRIGNQHVGKETILALDIQMDRERIKAYKFGYPGEEEYYSEKGVPLRRQFLRSPIRYGNILVSSKYNLKRLHPVLRRVQPHKGTDFAAPEGTEIYAIGSGRVLRQGRTRGNGNFIEIQHDDTYASMYLHMSRFVPGLKNGSTVRQGQLIGYVGSTGLSSGPHVCLRFKRWGSQIDILSAIFDKPNRLTEKEWNAFQVHRDSLDVRLVHPGL